MRDDRWTIPHPVGKGRRGRLVPVPAMGASRFLERDHRQEDISGGRKEWKGVGRIFVGSAVDATVLCVIVHICDPVSR
jgi:hypothetical protein